MSALAVYRDDGPLARLLVTTTRREPPLAGAPLALAAALVALAAIAVWGDGAGDPEAAAIVAAVVLLGAAATAGAERGRFAWAVPPLLRLAEYAGLLWIGALGGALPAAYALVAVLAFRHYDLVYRLRHRGTTPAPWVDRAALGWDGRLVLALVMLLAGALPAGFFVLAALLGVVFVAESVAGWSGDAGVPPGIYEEQEDEGQ